MAEWYVDYSNGDDTTGTGAVGAPYKTIAKALTVWAASDRINCRDNASHVVTTAIQPTGAMGGATALVPSIIEGYTTTAGDGGIATITCATNSVTIFNFLSGTSSTFFEFNNLILTHTAATRGKGITGATGAGSTACQLRLRDVEISGCSNGVDCASRVSLVGMQRRVYVHDCTAAGIATVGATLTMIDCIIDNNGGVGISYTANTNVTGHMFAYCQITRNTGDGVKYDVSTRPSISLIFQNCTIANNTGDGLDFAVGSTGTIILSIMDSVFWGNGAYNLVGGTRAQPPVVTNCAWGGAGTGNVSGTGYTTGDEPQTLSATPFVSTSDFTPSGTADGLLLADNGINGGFIGSYPNPSAGGGGGGILLTRGMNGGING